MPSYIQGQKHIPLFVAHSVHHDTWHRAFKTSKLLLNYIHLFLVTPNNASCSLEQTDGSFALKLGQLWLSSPLCSHFYFVLIFSMWTSLI